MKSIRFKEQNTGIGFNEDGTPQEQYNIIHAHKEPSEAYPGAVEFTMCFQLDEEERKQVTETGCIFLKRLMPIGAGFQPIGPTVLKPEGWESPKPENSDEITDSEEKLGAEAFDPETFDIKELDIKKVDYFYKRKAIKHLSISTQFQSEEVFDEALIDARNQAIKAAKTTQDQTASSPKPTKEQ